MGGRSIWKFDVVYYIATRRELNNTVTHILCSKRRTNDDSTSHASPRFDAAFRIYNPLFLSRFDRGVSPTRCRCLTFFRSSTTIQTCSILVYASHLTLLRFTFFEHFPFTTYSSGVSNSPVCVEFQRLNLEGSLI